MPLIINQNTDMFDQEQIKRGMLVYGRHSSWPEGKRGFVTSVVPHQLTVQYHPGISNVTNHFVICAAEVVADEWEIRWSDDLSQVFEYEVR